MLNLIPFFLSLALLAGCTAATPVNPDPFRPLMVQEADYRILDS